MVTGTRIVYGDFENWIDVSENKTDKTGDSGF